MLPEVQELQSRLVYERSKRKISQFELASAIGVTQGHLSYVEHGKRDLTLERYNYILDYFKEMGEPYEH